MKSIASVLNKYEVEKGKPRHISQEFQDYAYRLAVELEDTGHTAIYMRLSKKEDKALLEQARNFVKGSTMARNKARLFMWKLKQLREERKSGQSGRDGI